MFKKGLVAAAVFAASFSISARYDVKNNKQLPITSLEDAAKYIDLTAAYSNDRDESPGNFLLIPKFQIDGFFMTPMEFDGKKAQFTDTKQDGTPKDSVNLASVGYYFKSKDWNSSNPDVITKDDFDDSYKMTEEEFSCVEDGNWKISKLDYHDLNKSNVTMSIPASSLTKAEAQEALHQLSKGYRHVFMGDVRADADESIAVDPGIRRSAADWNQEIGDYNGHPSDVLVNVCVNPKTGKRQKGVDYLINGRWENDIYKNVYTWGSSQGYDGTGYGALYVEWDDANDMKAAMAGDVTKKADRIFVRNVQFSRLTNPGVGTGVIHNAQTILEYYKKAGLLTQKQFDDEMDLLDARTKGAKGGGGTTSPPNQLVRCEPKTKYTSKQNGEDIEDIVVEVGNLVYDKVIRGERVKKWEKAKIVFRYGSGIRNITRSGKDFVAYYVYDTQGELKQMRVENEAGNKDIEVYSVNNIGGINGTTTRTFFSDFDKVFKTKDRHVKSCWFDKWQ